MTKGSVISFFRQVKGCKIPKNGGDPLGEKKGNSYKSIANVKLHPARARLTPSFKPMPPTYASDNQVSPFHCQIVHMEEILS